MNSILFRFSTVIFLIVSQFSISVAGDTRYIIRQHASYAPVAGSGTAVYLSDEQVSEPLPIGFTFNFFGKAYTDFYISSNGFITFSDNGESGCCIGGTLPAVSTPNNLIAFAWANLNPDNGGSINYFTYGDSAKRKLVVNFVDIPHNGSNNLVSSQVILNEGSDIIEIYTQNMSSDGSAHTMGIENEDGSVGYAVPGRNSTDWSTAGDAVMFVPSSFVKNDVGVTSLNLLQQFCDVTKPVIATIANFGKNTVNNLTVNWKINGAVQSPVFYNTQLDSSSGNNPEAQVNLGSITFSSIPDTIVVWTSNPNGVQDSVNYNDTLYAIVHPSLPGGTYTIGGANPDYSSFNDAISAISQNGICGSVLFKVRNGTYNEQISIPQITGTSKGSTVTFESESGDSSAVVLNFAGNSTDNYTLQLNGADYFTFRKITIAALDYNYGNVVDISNSSNHNTFSNCVLQGITNSSEVVYSTSGSTDNYNSFRNNRIVNGNYGFYYESSSYNKEKGAVIENNIFENQYYIALYLYYQDSVIVRSNTINTNSPYTSYYDIYCFSCNNGLRIEKNKLYDSNGGYGIYLNSCLGTDSVPGLIANNFIQSGGAETAYGIYLSNSEHQKVYNNNISINTVSNYGAAVYIDGGGGSELSVSNSSTAVNSTNTIDVINNILSNTGGGYTLFINSPDLVNVSDYNDLYVTGTKFSYWLGDNTTLNDLRSASGKEIHSISVNPLYKSMTDLHVQEVNLNKAGTPLAEIQDDIDGEKRDNLKPDIGADEFVPPLIDAGIYSLQNPQAPFSSGNKDVTVMLKNHGSDTLKTVSIDWTVNNIQQTRFNWSGSLASGDTVNIKLGTYLFNSSVLYSLKSWTTLPNGKPDLVNTNDTIKVDSLFAAMAGIYTIGGISPDFQNFQAAVTALKQAGIASNVVFKVRNGTYNEQISIPQIIGTSKNATITFESESGDSSTVSLGFAANSTTNYTLQLNGASYFFFRKISITAFDNNYGRVVELTNGANNNTITNCVLQGSAVSTSSDYLSIIYSYNSKNEFNSFRNNRIVNGSYGLYDYSNYDLAKGTVIENNIFENQYYQALYFYYQDSLTVRNNTINTNSLYTSYYAVYCAVCNNQLRIEKNKINIPNGGFGIYLNSSQGTASSPGVVSNNFVQIGGNGTAYGVYLYYSSYQKIYNNSVNVTSTVAGNGYAIYIGYSYYNNTIDLVNNIFANTGGGYALYNQYPSSINISDYNDLYTTGAKLAYLSSDVFTLNDLRSATGKDVHSISQNPLFTSASDLHVHEIWLNAVGMPIPEVIDDIDGEKRDLIKPDIGADEFIPVQTDAGLYALGKPTTPFPSGNNDIVVVLKNHGADTLKTVSIDWTVNGSPQTRFNWTGSLASGDTVNVKLGTYLFNPFASYNVKSWTTLPNGKPDVINTNDTINLNNLYAAMIGVYTIGGSSPDFPNFQAAVTALKQAGVAGTVVFKVRNGTYNEQVSIPEIIGSSGNSTITFESESGDSTQVILTFTADNNNNYTLQFNGADFIRFQKMTLSSAANYYYARVVDISNGSNNNTVSNCILQGSTYIYYDYTAVIYSNTSVDSYNSFRNNRILNGGYGFYYYGMSGSGMENGTVIENNIFENQYYQALDLYYQDSLIVRKNIISTNLTNGSYNGIYCGTCNNQLKIEKNQLNVPNGGYGIYLNGCQGTSSFSGLVSNNFIEVGGTNTAYGIYLYSSGYQKIYNNNVNVTDNSVAYGRALDLGYYNSNLDIKNNNLVNSGGGYAVYNEYSSDYGTSDYNNLYTTGAKLAYWSGDKVALSDWRSASGKDVHSISVDPLYKSTTDLHVREITLNRAGISLAEITDDIDSELRDSSKPDIGADEFNPIQTDAGIYSLENPTKPFSSGNSDVVVTLKNHGADTLKSVSIDWTVNNDQQVRINWTGLLPSGDTVHVKLGTYLFNSSTSYNIKSWTTLPNGKPDVINTNDTITSNNLLAGLIGVYTIGGTNPDFVNFSAADTALSKAGVLGDVLFKVRNGVYYEQISIPEIKGVTQNSTVTFESESGDSSAVILNYTGTSSNNYTLQLNGADYFSFRKMSIAALDNNYGRVIDISNGSGHNTFSKCIIKGVLNSSEVVYSNNIYKNEYNNFINNRILNGSYGLYYYATSGANTEKGIVIEDNIFENQYYQALYLYYQDSVTVRGNTINTNSTYTNFYSIYGAYCNNQLRIEKNKINIPNGGIGIYLNSCQGTNLLPNLISNNFVQIGGSSTAYGMYLYYSAYQKIYNNNINITSTLASSGNAIYISYSNYYYTVDIVNNIFANTGGGYALYNQYPYTVNVSDYNDLYTTGTKLAYWSGDKINLNDLQSTSGKDAHSISQDPLFKSVTDLHVREIKLNTTGTFLAQVKDDIDGEKRDSLKPDIGADEFTPPLTDAGIYFLNSPKIPFPSGNNDVVVALKNHGSDTLKTVMIDWTVNGDQQVRFNWSGTLPSGDTVYVKLGTYNFTPKTMYSIKSWTLLPNGKPDLVNTNDTVKVDNLIAGLIGVYTIGGTNPDFASFQAADTALNKAGVIGNVIFKVRNGTYNEQLSVPETKGVNKNTTVIFESESGDSTKVNLSYAANYTNNFTLQLNGADYFSFRNISITSLDNNYGNVIDIRNSSAHNTFSNCILQGIVNSSSIIYSAGASKDDYNSFRNNRIINGSYGFYYDASGSSGLEKGTVIENNVFENQYYQGLYLYYQDSLTARGNTINTNSAYASYYSIYGVYCNNQLRIEKNKIYVPNGGYGIYLNSCQGTSSFSGLVSNNFIQVGGSSTAYGIYLYSSGYQKIYNNNINVTSNSAVYGRALDLGYYNYNLDIKNNNIINSGGGYALYNEYSSDYGISDYNDLYTTGAQLAYWSGDKATLSDLRSASGKDIHSLSVNPLYKSNIDLHVREVTLAKAGLPLPEVKDDIDGDIRDLSYPCIGADEFILGTPNDAGITSISYPKTPFAPGIQNVYVKLRNYGADTLKNVRIKWKVNNVSQVSYQWTGSIAPAKGDSVNIGSYNFQSAFVYSITAWSEIPNGVTDTLNYNDTASVNNLYAAMSGVYTIGGTSPDFKTFSEAANRLSLAGVIGQVTFNVRPGNYKDQLSLGQINGASALNNIVFQSENGDSSKVILEDSSSTYIIQLDRTGYVTFNHLTIRNDYPYYGRVIEIKNGASHDMFFNNILQGVNTSYTGTESSVIFSSNSSSSYNQFKNNLFINGSYGIFLQGVDNNNDQIGNIIVNNNFNEQNYFAIYSQYQDGIIISKNSIKSSSTLVSVYGCYLSYSKGALEITKNKISLVNDGYGLYCDNFIGTSATQGIIANNFISVGGTLTAYGIYLGYNNSFLDVYNNNVNVRNVAQSSTAFYYNNGSNNSVVNNVFSNSGNGYALTVNNLNTIRISNYNDLYTTGNFLASYNNQQYKDLSAWKQVSNMDNHSVSIDPLFTSGNDLHVSQIALNGVGLTLPVITDDIDGDPRNQNTPDIGADEFENVKHDIGVTEILPASSCLLSNSESITVTVKNFGAFNETGFDVAYSIDNSSAVIEKVTQSLSPGGSVKYTFNAKANLSAIRNYSLTAYSKLTTDEKLTNDTTVSTVSNMSRLKIKLTGDTLICSGTNIILSASGADYYKWNTGSVNSIIYVNPYYTSTYTVIGTNIFNCQDIETLTVHVNPVPATPVVTPSGPVNFCNGRSQVLTSNVNHNVVWSTGEKLPSITVYHTGNYSVKYTDSLGCSATSVPVQISEEKAPTITPQNLSICSNDTVLLSVDNAVKFSWSTGAQTASIKVLPGSSATYSVTATTALGCTFTLNSTINILPAKTPGQVAGMIPDNGAVDLSLPLEVSWLPAENGTNYDLFVWPSNQSKPSTPFASNVNSIRYKFGPGTLTYGVTYKWQVISKYYSCESTPGPVQTFMLRYLPDLVINNVQIPYSAYTGQNIDITWEVKNQGLGNTAHGQWNDQLNMSIDTVNDEFYILGKVPNATYLEPGQSYSKKASFTLPKYKDGLFNIFSWTDRDNQLLETNDNNNQGRSASALWVKLTPPPDLYVNSIVTPSDFFSEDTINVSWTVINKGKWQTETNAWTDRVYISQDFNNAQKYIIGTFNHVGDTLYPDQSYSTTHPVIIPEAIFGKYYIYVETDIYNNVYEHAYDGNNVSQSDSVNVILRPPADMMVSNIVIPKSVTNIESANIKWKVTNIGNSSPNDKDWYDGVYLTKSPNYDLSNAYFFSFHRSKLTGIPVDFTYNSDESIKIPDLIQPGDYYVYVKTDVNDQIFEYQYEKNNLLRSDTTMKITIAPWPDLIVSNFNHPDSAGAGEPIHIKYTVTNNGTATAQGAWSDKIFISQNNGDCPKGVLLKTIKRTSPLPNNSSYVVDTTVTLPTGFYYGSNKYCISVYTDEENTVYEHTDETNNDTTNMIFIKPSDLTVTTATVPAQIYSGSAVDLNWIVKNSGNATSPAIFWRDKIELLDSTYTSLTGYNENMYWKYGPVKPGSSYTNQNNIIIPDGIFGNYYIRFTTDLFNENNEKVTANNVKIVPVKIILRNPSDLIITSFNLPSNAIAGQPVNMQWNVKNVGPGATLAQGWTDRIYLSQDTTIDPYNDILLGSYQRSGGLTSQDSYTLSEQVFLPINTVGNYYVIVKTDFPTSYNPFGEEYEYKAEENNSVNSLMAITLAPPSDLIVTQVSVPANAITGDPATIGWTVKNQGPNKAEGYMTDMIYFSKDSVWDITDPLFGENPVYVQLQPNEEKTYSLTTELNGTAAGDYYVLVRTDNRNNINEVNDKNNTLSSSSKVNVEVPLLPLYVLKQKTLNNNKGIYYRLEIPDSLIDETLLITLKGDSIKGNNELYISYDSVPDRSNSDYASTGKPFFGNQEVIVPSLKKGTYYLLVYGNVSVGTAQNISLYAQIIHFQIRSLMANEGGNNGNITVEVDGARFTKDMKLQLQTSTKVIAADSILFVDATKVFATFNLKDAPLGFRDVVAIKTNGDTAILKNGFKVVEKSPFGLVTSVKAPVRMRRNTIDIISVQFANDGNVDIPTPSFKLISMDGLPISFLKKDLTKYQTELIFDCHEVNGPQNVLRPGAIGTVYIWVWATKTGLTHFRFE